MRYRTSFAAIFVPILLASTAQAQTPMPATDWQKLPGGTWESIAKLPDWTGAWQPKRIPGEPGQPSTSTKLNLLPGAKERFEAVAAIDKAGGDKPSRNLHCVTRGLPGDMGSAETTIQYAYTPGQILMTFVEGSVRHIYTDGRNHIDKSQVVDTFQGDSIGHWEGDTLVIDTVALNEGNEFVSGFAQGPNSHLVERVHLTGPDDMIIENTFDAPTVLDGQFKFNNHYGRHRDWEMLEFDCAQNNADLDASGKQIFASPPP